MNDPILPWYIAGPLLGMVVPLLILLNDKSFGVSSSFRAVVSSIFPFGSYFNYDRKRDLWQIWLALGLIAAAFVAFQVLELGNSYSSKEFVASTDFVYSLENGINMFFGAFLVGFGARYANGCTAGHCIMGNAQFSLGSFLATIGFFLGGLLTTHFILPLIY
jgi:uncharacterized membrane protein YedE/YeeE